MRVYWFTPDSPECESEEEAIQEWQTTQRGSLPAVLFWTDYDANGKTTGQGNYALEAPHGRVVHWSE